MEPRQGPNWTPLRHNQVMHRVPVDSHLHLPSGLAKDVVAELKRDCTHSNPAWHKAKAMGFKWTKEPKVIMTWKEASDGHLVLPRGRTAEVRSALGSLELIDNRFEGSFQVEHPHHCVDLWDHQERVVEAILDIEQGIVRAPTGSGKTTAAIAAIARANVPTLIIVWNSNLLQQWVDRLMVELALDEEDVGVIGGGKHRIRPITVAMQQTLARSPKKLKECIETFGFVCCDELQRFAADTFTKVVDPFPAKYRIGLSADETRKDRKEFLIYDLFGRVIADVDRHELEAKGKVVPVEIELYPTDFEAPWYREQMQSDDTNPDFNRLLEEMTRDDQRNSLIDRLISDATTGGQTIVFTHRREHALTIQMRQAGSGNDCGLLLGGADDKAAFEDAKRELVSDAIALAVGTYQAVGVGIDIPRIRAGICTTPIHSNRQFFGQVRGRLCRSAPGKDRARMLYLWDRGLFGDSPLHNLSKWNDRRVKVFDRGTLVPVEQYLEDQDDR